MDSAGGEPKSSRRFFGDAGELAPSPLLARGEKRVALPCLARARLASYCRFGRFPWAWPGRALSSVRCGPHSESRQPNGPLSSRAGQAGPNAGNQTRPYWCLRALQPDVSYPPQTLGHCLDLKLPPNWTHETQSKRPSRLPDHCLDIKLLLNRTRNAV